MANKHPTPPPPRVATAQHPHLERPGQSLVEQYNLTAVVEEKRRQGMSYPELTKFINESNLIPNGYKIALPTLARYCREHNLGGDITEQNTEEVINVYRQKLDNLNTTNRRLESLNAWLDAQDKNIVSGDINMKDYTMALNTFDKLSLRKQTLTTDIENTQKEIFKFETYSEIVQLTMAKIATFLPPEEYTRLKQELANDPKICEGLRRIAPSNI